jgi:phage terminase small subunit
VAAGGDQDERLKDLEDLEDGVMRSKDVGRVKSLERDLKEREEALRKSEDLREFGTRMLKKANDDLKSKEKQLGEINVKFKAMSVDQVEQRQTRQHEAALVTANDRNWRRPGDTSGAGTQTAPQSNARDNQQSRGNPDNAWHRELTDTFKQAQI